MQYSKRFRMVSWNGSRKQRVKQRNSFNAPPRSWNLSLISQYPWKRWRVCARRCATRYAPETPKLRVADRRSTIIIEIPRDRTRHARMHARRVPIRRIRDGSIKVVWDESTKGRANAARIRRVWVVWTWRARIRRDDPPGLDSREYEAEKGIIFLQ